MRKNGQFRLKYRLFGVVCWALLCAVMAQFGFISNALAACNPPGVGRFEMELKINGKRPYVCSLEISDFANLTLIFNPNNPEYTGPKKGAVYFSNIPACLKIWKDADKTEQVTSADEWDVKNIPAQWYLEPLTGSCYGTITISYKNEKGFYSECDATVYIINVGSIVASSAVANNSPQMFAGHQTDFGDPCSPGSVPGQALIIFFDKVRKVNEAGEEEVNDFNVDMHANVSGASENELSEYWRKSSGPTSGELDKTTTFDVKFKNPKEGGLYKFEFDIGVAGCSKSGVNVLLPLAGAESADFAKSEFQRVTGWVQDRIQDWSPPGGIELEDRIRAMNLLGLMWAVSLDFDYYGQWKGGNSPCQRFKYQPPDRISPDTLTIEGVVMNNAKLSNMMWGVLIRRFMYWDWFRNLQAEIFSRIESRGRIGDSAAARKSYELGRTLVEEGIESLHGNMVKYRDLIREPDDISGKLFSSTDLLQTGPSVPELP